MFATMQDFFDLADYILVFWGRELGILDSSLRFSLSHYDHFVVTFQLHAISSRYESNKLARTYKYARTI